jgi:hypothetical protein
MSRPYRPPWSDNISNFGELNKGEAPHNYYHSPRSHFLYLRSIQFTQLPMFCTVTPSNIPALKVVVFDKQAFKSTKARTRKWRRQFMTVCDNSRWSQRRRGGEVSTSKTRLSRDTLSNSILQPNWVSGALYMQSFYSGNNFSTSFKPLKSMNVRYRHCRLLHNEL